MSWIPQVVIILGVAAAGGLSPVVNAQLSPTPPTQPEPAVHNQTAPESNNQLSNKPDLNLLAKTITNFIKSERYQTESELQIGGTTSSLNFTSFVQIKTIAQSPKRFRADITFGKLGDSTAKRYLVVSNGSQVWTYVPDLKQYAVTDYPVFEKSNDSLLIGMSSYFFLQLSPKFREVIAEESLSNQKIMDLLAQMILSENVPLKGGRQNIQGKEYYVYEYTDNQKGYTFSVFAQPETATVEQLQITGKSQGLDIVIKEQIIRRVENPVVTEDTFSFSPVAGFTKVESLPIKPY